MHSSPDGAPPDISSFLRSLGASDLKHMRMLASLCGLTYYMGTRVTPRALARRHRLELISTSLACELISFEKEASAAEVAAEGDGACLGLADAYAIYGDRGREAPAVAAAEQPAMAALANVVPFSRSLLGSSVAASNQRRALSAATAAAAAAAAQQPPQHQLPGPLHQQQQQQQNNRDAGGLELAVSGAQQPAPQLAVAAAERAASPTPAAGASWNPADLVAAKLGEAAAAASAAALAPLASAASAATAAAGSFYAGSLGRVSARLFPSSAPAALAAAAAAAASAAPAGPQPLLPDRLAGAAIAGIAGLEVAASHPNGAEVKAASTSSAACPSEWFVADDGAAHLRYFVIQGSDSLDHWRTNLMFEPVVFEDPALGIRVHRGAYEAACALYDRFLPLVQEQVHSHALAKVAFTGHSIGGSMATLLALMYVVRGVLRPDQLAPTITFGSPAIFCARARGGCGGAGCGGCGSCGAACPGNGNSAAAAAAGPGGILEDLGLGPGSVRNVLMARDIVPRAFSCDYSLVADILRSWGPHWRDHNCLNWAARKQMFVHIGRAVVLQPSPALRFAAEPGLPLLPAGGGAWELSPPTLAARMRAAAMRAAALREGRPAAREAACVDEALAALMDNPHPLETLGDPGAYLDSGSISRYHNPDNYCRALGRLLAERRDADAAALARPARAPALAAARRAALLAAAAGEAAAVSKTAAR